MGFKKLSRFATLEIVFAIVSALCSVAALVLIKTGVIPITDENSTFSDGVAAVFGIVLYIIFMMCHGAVFIYMLIEGFSVKGALKSGKWVPRLLLIIGGIVKVVFAVVAVFLACVFISVKLYVFAAAALIFTAAVLAVSILGFICASENKSGEHLKVY